VVEHQMDVDAAAAQLRDEVVEAGKGLGVHSRRRGGIDPPLGRRLGVLRHADIVGAELRQPSGDALGHGAIGHRSARRDVEPEQAHPLGAPIEVPVMPDV